MKSETASVECLSKHLCGRFGCDAEEVEEKLLLRCIPWWKRPWWHLAARIASSAFEHDRLLIREVCGATSLHDVSIAIESSHYQRKINPSFWRNTLGLRVSGRRLHAIASQYFGQE
jgi:hypothetical protein